MYIGESLNVSTVTIFSAVKMTSDSQSVQFKCMNNVNQPAFTLHRRDSTPRSFLWVKHFNGRQPLRAVVTAKSVQSVTHHSHTDTTPKHGHCFCQLPATNNGIIHLYGTQWVACHKDMARDEYGMCPHRSTYGHMYMSSTTRDDMYLKVCLL